MRRARCVASAARVCRVATEVTTRRFSVQVRRLHRRQDAARVLLTACAFVERRRGSGGGGCGETSAQHALVVAPTPAGGRATAGQRRAAVRRSCCCAVAEVRPVSHTLSLAVRFPPPFLSLLPHACRSRPELGWRRPPAPPAPQEAAPPAESVAPPSASAPAAKGEPAPALVPEESEPGPFSPAGAEDVAAAEASLAREGEQQRVAEAQLRTLEAQAASAASADEAALEAAQADAVLTAVRSAEASAAAGAAAEALRAAEAAADAAQAAVRSAEELVTPPIPQAVPPATPPTPMVQDGDGDGDGDGDPFAELPPLPERPPLAPGALVLRTLASGAPAGNEWALVYAAMLRQAETDALAFQGDLQARHAEFAARLNAVRDAAAARVADARSAAQAAEARATRLRAVLAAAQQAHQVALERDRLALARRAEADSRALAAQLALTTARAALAERTERIMALDATRAQLNALAAAFAARQALREEAAASHAIASEVMAFQRALECGAPLQVPLQRILTLSRDDALVRAVAASLPDEALQGTLPRTALAAALEAASARARQLALLPSDQPAGILSRLLAVAAAPMRCAEPQQALPGGGGVEACLTRAAKHLHAGRLADAADELTEGMLKGTLAVGALQSLAQALRARAAAEQAHKVLRAHVATLTAAHV